MAAAQGVSQVQAQAESFGRSLFAAQVNDAGITNTQFVTNLYEGFLQRGPDAGGLGFWSGQATVGTGRQNVLNAFATSGSFYELAGTLYREAFWLVADHLGTPRMIASKSGTLASVKRHDYLPFGEELYAGMSGRTTTQGYTGDSTRQHFTGYEADAATGLNFAEARYQSSLQGRFTSVDPLGASASVGDPQSFNRYSYVNNNPTNLIDPSGLQAYDASNSYTDAAGSLEAQPFDPNRSHFGGPAILYAAGALQGVSLAGSLRQSCREPTSGSTPARAGNAPVIPSFSNDIAGSPLYQEQMDLAPQPNVIVIPGSLIANTYPLPDGNYVSGVFFHLYY